MRRMGQLEEQEVNLAVHLQGEIPLVLNLHGTKSHLYHACSWYYPTP
jgi:hypothetical protein